MTSASTSNRPSTPKPYKPGDLTWYNGFTSPGRRVALPWSEPGFDINWLTNDGKTVLRRALEWASGMDTP